jgi:branched-chain amino acid transport system substrate-binding protein
MIMIRRVSLLVTLLSVVSCQPKEKEVRVAVAVPLTGDIATLGQGIRRATRLAVEEATAAGRFPDFKLTVVEFDDRADPKEAVTVANRIVADPSVVAVVGHFNSGCSIPASAVYAQAHVPMVSPAASNPELTRQQLSEKWRWPRSIFRVNTTDDVQGAAGANFVKDQLNIDKNVCVIHDKTAYGQGIAEEFKKRFEEKGGQLTSFDGIQVGDKDFKALLTRVKSLNPQVLYFGGIFNEGGLIVRQAREVGLKAVFVASEANYDPEFLRIAGPAAEGAVVSFLGKPPELLDSAKRFVEAYKHRYPTDELKAYDHYAYEITGMLMEALEKVGPDRDKITAHLQGINYEGVLGTTSFDEKGDTLNKIITLFIVKNGQFVPYN